MLDKNNDINHNEIVYDETGYYSIIPQSVFWELSGNAVKVYGFYKSVSINKNNSFYGIEKIRKGTGGLSYETIIKCKKELIEKKYISIKKRFNGTDIVTLLHKKSMSILEFLDNDNDNLIENSTQFSENPKIEKSENRENRKSENPNAVFGKSELQFSENPKGSNNNLNINKLSREEVTRAPARSDFENFITDFLVSYQKLMGHAVSDIIQVPFFKTYQNRSELKSIFDNRRYNHRQCLNSAFEFANKRPPDKRFFSFYDCLKIYLQNGNDGLIARHYSEAELLEREKAEKQKAEKQKAEEERLALAEKTEAERHGLTVAEYRKKLEAEEDNIINEIRQSLRGA